MRAEGLNTAMDEREEFRTGSARPGSQRRTPCIRVIPVRGSQRGCLEIEPVTLFGAWVSASGSEEVRQMFRRLGESFSDATSSSVELLAAEVSGDLAYTAHREITSTTVDGRPRGYVLRVTQVQPAGRRRMEGRAPARDEEITPDAAR
jgi:hypothetical protein